MTNFWTELKNKQQPFFCVAPMADVTDAAFRRLLVKYGKPDVVWTEFVSADGLMSEGREILKKDLEYTQAERPILAQLFSSNPEKMEEAARLCAALGFDGIDINMGCPDRSIEKQGAGAAMIRTPEVAARIIAAAKRGAPHLPISVKTRVGYNAVQLDEWIPFLLKQGVSALTVHARTRKELSNVPARWEHVKRVVALRDELAPDTVIIGNGDALSLADAREKAKASGCDGVMVGRALFGNPWFFADVADAKHPSNIEHPAPFSPTKHAPNETLNLFQKIRLAILGRNSAERSEWIAFNRSRENGAGVAFEDRHKYWLTRTLDIPVSERLSVLAEHAALFEELLGSVKHFAVMKKHFKAYCTGFPGAKELRMELMETKNAGEVGETVRRFLTKR